MTKRFKILDTNLENITDTHFVCDTVVGTKAVILNLEEPFKTFMFDGLNVKLVKDDKYIYGEVHG